MPHPLYETLHIELTMMLYRHTERPILISKIACILDLGVDVVMVAVHRMLVGEGRLGELVAQNPLLVAVVLDEVREGTTMIQVQLVEAEVPLLARVLTE